MGASWLHASVGDFNALWSWDAQRSKWYFYSPSIDSGVPFTDAQYCTANSFLDFGGGTLPAPALNFAPGVGIWAEKF